ncbi:MAG: MBL fold metallo-hydrolase, partial [Nannocystaceae bacterium]
VLDGDVGGLSVPAGFMQAGALPSEIVGALRAQQRLLNPHLLLREGLQDPSLVGDGGMDDVDGVPHRVATLTGDTAEIRLLVNEDTGFITRLDTMENNMLVRDVSVQVRYGSWESRGALAFPSTITLSIDGQALLEETRTGVELEPTVEEGYFDLPPEAGRPTVDEVELAYGHQTEQAVDAFFNLGFAFPEQPELQVLPLTPNVTLLAGQTNIVAVSYDQGLIVLEAPITPAHGVNVLDSLALTFPGSPVTHLFQSHHHQDHAGGIRSFVADGATIVVGAGVASFYEGVFGAPSTVRPDLLSETDVTPVIEELGDGGTFELSDATVTVTGHHLASAHSQDMVITTVDVPGARFVYVADLYNAGLGGTLILGGPEEFFAALRDFGIIEADCSSAVPLTIIPSHGFPLSLADSLAEVTGLGLDVGC